MADESEVVSVMRMGWTEEEGDDVEIITIRRLAMIAIAWWTSLAPTDGPIV